MTRALLVDLGKVLVGFDHQITCDRLEAATGLPADRFRPVLFGELEAGVQLVDWAGIVYGTRIVTVKPFSMHQLNDVFGAEFASFQPPAGGPWRLNMFVNLDNGARNLGYATVTDTRTGDPYLIPAQAMRP